MDPYSIARMSSEQSPELDTEEEPFIFANESQTAKRRVKGIKTLAMVACAIGAIVIIMVAMSNEGWEAFVVVLLCFSALAVSLQLTYSLLAKNVGTSRMQEIAGFIEQGAQGFFRTQYRTIFIMTCITAALLFLGFVFRPTSGGMDIRPSTLAFITVISFLAGASCSCFAGYIGLWISVRTNVRVASAAKHSYLKSVQIALQGGIIAALVVVGLVDAGLLVLYLVLESVFVGADNVATHANEVPMLMVGFSFGASFVALFAQLGGGIFTKAADVGADLVGKVESGIPEDDPRNPAVIADLVGDNVGDCAGRGADLFESIAAEVISAMILGGTMAKEAKIPGKGFVMFPLVVHGFDLVVSTAGYFAVACRRSSKSNDSSLGQGSPLRILAKGFIVAGTLSIVTFTIATRWLLYVEHAPSAWWHFLCCGLYGMAAGYSSVAVTTYYTSTNYAPVKDIAEASVSGHATNVVMGISVGMASTALPALIMSVTLLCSFWTGRASGLVDSNKEPIGGLFGTAVATMGMLSTAVFVLGMDFFGPIADNAGGIVEMSDESEDVRAITDELDAVGNTTKAATKGYAICSAALACFLLFSAFQDEVSAIRGGEKMGAVDLSQPEMFVAGLLGAMLVFLFSAWTIRAVGDVAQCVVKEVRRQFASRPGILDGKETPDYSRCVAIVTKQSLRKMIKPGLLAAIYPVLIGLVFRLIGSYIDNDPMLGARAVCSMLMFSTVTGILTALFLNNSGGAWDNAKKLVESGAHGGKGSDAHKAAITGDTVGDPFKDAAGPSIHVLIKLLSTVTLVMAPLFVSSPER